MRKTELERYKGSRSRHTCPSCGHRQEFSRYIYLDTGEYLDESVGRCNRLDGCNYHRTPREHFQAFTFTESSAEHMNNNHVMNTVNSVNVANKANVRNALNNQRGVNDSNSLNAVNGLNGIERLDYRNPPAQKSEIDKAYLTRSFAHTEHNRFFNFLLAFIDEEIVEEAIKNYLVGTTKSGETLYWLIDKDGIVRGGKIIDYDEQTGKRNKNKHANSIVAKLKRAGALPQNFIQFSCIFGEHLLRTDREKIVAVVEAEKTAFIASMFLPQFLWVAVGSKDWINNTERMAPLKNRRIVLFPDLGAFDTWKNFEINAKQIGYQVSTSTLLEECATARQREEKWDLADYLVSNELFAQGYNWKLDAVLASADRQDYLCELIEERLAIIAESETIDNEEEFLAANRDILRDAVRMAI